MTTHADKLVTELRQMALRMGALAEAILEKANRSLLERDAVLAAEVKHDDLAIDRLDVDLDEALMRSLALQAPVAADLRLVFAVKTMATDLERVGDIARNMAACAMRLSERPATVLAERLEPLQREAAELLSRALDAFQRTDADAARQVIEADDVIDELQDKLVQDAIQYLSKHPDEAGQAVDVILIAENLERVGDHATNIAEDVILVAEAQNVKHASKL